MLFYDIVDSMIKQESPVRTEVDYNYQDKGIRALRIRDIENFDSWELDVRREQRTVGVDMYRLYGKENEKRDIEKSVSLGGNDRELRYISHFTKMLEDHGL